MSDSKDWLVRLDLNTEIAQVAVVWVPILICNSPSCPPSILMRGGPGVNGWGAIPGTLFKSTGERNERSRIQHICAWRNGHSGHTGRLDHTCDHLHHDRVVGLPAGRGDLLPDWHHPRLDDLAGLRVMPWEMRVIMTAFLVLFGWCLLDVGISKHMSTTVIVSASATVIWVMLLHLVWSTP